MSVVELFDGVTNTFLLFLKSITMAMGVLGVFVAFLSFVPWFLLCFVAVIMDKEKVIG